MNSSPFGALAALRETSVPDMTPVRAHRTVQGGWRRVDVWHLMRDA